MFDLSMPVAGNWAEGLSDEELAVSTSRTIRGLERHWWVELDKATRQPCVCGDRDFWRRALADSNEFDAIIARAIHRIVEGCQGRLKKRTLLKYMRNHVTTHLVAAAVCEGLDGVIALAGPPRAASHKASVH
jgi:hypothetical protein